MEQELKQCIEVNKKEPSVYSRVRCSNEIYDEVANIANECDLTIKQVTDALLSFALPFANIVSTNRVVTENKLVIGDKYEHNNQ